MDESTKKNIEYLDWYFTCDDGTADKDAQKAWSELRKQITKANLMDKNKDLAEKIYWILIEEGQHNLKFPLGSIITNTPDEVRDIVRKHIEELT